MFFSSQQASGGPPSEFLKKIELPVIDKAQCLAESEREFRPNITPGMQTQIEFYQVCSIIIRNFHVNYSSFLDKFCAGYLNANVGVCQGNVEASHYLNHILI